MVGRAAVNICWAFVYWCSHFISWFPKITFSRSSGVSDCIFCLFVRLLKCYTTTVSSSIFLLRKCMSRFCLYLNWWYLAFGNHFIIRILSASWCIHLFSSGILMFWPVQLQIGCLPIHSGAAILVQLHSRVTQEVVGWFMLVQAVFRW